MFILVRAVYRSSMFVSRLGSSQQGFRMRRKQGGNTWQHCCTRYTCLLFSPRKSRNILMKFFPPDEFDVSDMKTYDVLKGGHPNSRGDPHGRILGITLRKIAIFSFLAMLFRAIPCGCARAHSGLYSFTYL